MTVANDPLTDVTSGGSPVTLIVAVCTGVQPLAATAPPFTNGTFERKL
jgi:hypothetical protein